MLVLFCLTLASSVQAANVFVQFLPVTACINTVDSQSKKVSIFCPFFMRQSCSLISDREDYIPKETYHDVTNKITGLANHISCLHKRNV